MSIAERNLGAILSLGAGRSDLSPIERVCLRLPKTFFKLEMPEIQYNVVFRLGNATPGPGQIIVNGNELRIPPSECPDLQAYVTDNASGPAPVVIKIKQGDLEKTINVYTLETSGYSTLYAFGDIAAEFAALGFTSYQSAVISIPSSGGGLVGDPYVKTVNGAYYKLPTIDAPIRIFQGLVGGKILTVNAQLRTIPNDELMISNFSSFLDLKGSLSIRKQKVLEKAVFNTENLCFFEKFFISHGGTKLVMNVWDQKFKVESYTGDRFPSSVIDGAHLTEKYSNIYKDYSSQTLKISISKTTAVFISVYAAPILRNGIFVEGPCVEAGNGAMVNVLSSKDMILAALDSTTSVVKRDAPIYVKREIFADKYGCREKKIYVTE
jgi:hypothetical protein